MNSVTAVRTQDPTPTAAVVGSAAAVVEPPGDSDQIFGPGLGILQLYSRMLTQLAKDHQDQMKMHGETGNEAQKMVSAVDALIAEIDMKDKPGGTVLWSPELIDYVNSHDEFNIGFNPSTDKARCTKLRGEIQKYATQHSDATAQVQLQVQKTMQTYNVTVGLMNSLQTMLAEMTKQFAQAIR